MENQTGRKVKILRSDGGGAYISKECKDVNQTLTECARNIRLQADMSERFWAKVVNHASYLLNQVTINGY